MKTSLFCVNNFLNMWVITVTFYVVNDQLCAPSDYIRSNSLLNGKLINFN